MVAVSPIFVLRNPVHRNSKAWCAWIMLLQVISAPQAPPLEHDISVSVRCRTSRGRDGAPNEERGYRVGSAMVGAVPRLMQAPMRVVRAAVEVLVEEEACWDCAAFEGPVATRATGRNAISRNECEFCSWLSDSMRWGRILLWWLIGGGLQLAGRSSLTSVRLRLEPPRR